MRENFRSGSRHHLLWDKEANNILSLVGDDINNSESGACDKLKTYFLSSRWGSLVAILPSPRDICFLVLGNRLRQSLDVLLYPISKRSSSPFINILDEEEERDDICRFTQVPLEEIF